MGFRRLELEVYGVMPHGIRDPYGYLLRTFAEHVIECLSRRGVEANIEEITRQIVEPPSPSMGDLGIALHRYARKACVNPVQLALECRDYLAGLDGVVEAKAVNGYLNLFYDSTYIARITLESIKEYGDYGFNPVDKPLRIIVEHTSANPIHPLHIGHARNSFLGDTLARLLANRGHKVQTRFYVDDTGRQVAILALGYKLLGEPEPPDNVKPDEWLGRIYALINLLIELKNIRNELKDIEREVKAGYAGEDRIERYRQLISKQDEIAADIGRLWEKDKELFDKLSKAVMEYSCDFEDEIRRIMIGYEKGEDWAKRLVRRVVEIALKGIRETLDKLGIGFDKWDYESDLVWSGLVEKIIMEARNTPYYTVYKGAEALDLPKLARDKDLLKRLGIRIRGEIPPLILRRSDGTTLYTTKDIAYTIYKFRDYNADKVINVIGGEQRLPQAQVKLALYALGYHREALNLITYIYEMVNIPGMKMSSRRYRIITLDWLLDQLYQRAKAEVDERRSDLDEEARERIAWAIAVGAARFTMAGYDPLKPLTFSFDKALDIGENSAPYLMYTFARANSVLRKAGGIDWDNIDYGRIGDDIKRKLLWLIMKYPWIAGKAADDLSPELLANHLLRIADTFNKWYEMERIIDEKDPGYRSLKLALTLGVKKTIGHGLRMFGIEPLEQI